MKKLITILWIFLFLTSCSNSQNSEEIENNAFEKKKECALLYDSVYEWLEKKYWEIIDWFDTTWYYQIENPEIHYSSSLNSCISYTEVIERVKRDELNAIYNLEITDLLTKEVIDLAVCYDWADWEKINWISQYTDENLTKFSDCTRTITEKLNQLKN